MPYRPLLSLDHVQSDGVYFNRVVGLYIVCCVCIDLDGMTKKQKAYKTWGLARPLTLEVGENFRPLHEGDPVECRIAGPEAALSGLGGGTT